MVIAFGVLPAQAAQGDLDSNGSLDPTFNGNGIVLTAIGSYRDYGWAVVLQPDGKIILAGDSEYGAYSDFAVVRYNRNGSLNTMFGTAGIVTTPIGITHDVGRTMAFQPDGSILVAGYFTVSATDLDIAVVRYSGDATPTVTTSEVSSITQTSAVGGAQVTGDVSTDIRADVTARGVCWGTAAEPTLMDNITEDGTGTGTFTSEITGLTSGPVYYVRAYATKWRGTAYGEERTFTTLEEDDDDGGDEVSDDGGG